MLYFETSHRPVPRLGFGTWELEGDDASDAVKTALELGYRHIDTAIAYENEKQVGNAIAESGVARDEIFLTTKIFLKDIRNGRVAEATDESLDRLGTDYVDLLLLHWPVNDMPIRDQVTQLAEIKKSGKAKLVGVSNYTLEQMREAVDACPDIACLQAEYHPMLDQTPLLTFARDNDILFTAYSPLGRGDLIDNPVVSDIADSYGRHPTQVLLRWHLQQSNVAPIPKSTSREHIAANLDVFNFELNEEEMQRLFGLRDKNGRIIDPDWAPDWDTGVAA